jgi:hypothetical protein
MIDEIISIEEVECNSLRYDIEVEDLNNFFANGVLVHNCQNLISEIFDDGTNRTAQYEVTTKLDGSSCTFFHRDGEVGVCSRNLQLKVNDENKDNSFVRMLFDSGLNWALEKYGNIAVQGELMGPGIQGNRENLKDFRFYVFDVQLLDEGRYMTPTERYAFMRDLGYRGVNVFGKVFHAPVLCRDRKFVDHVFDLPTDDSSWTFEELSINNVKELLTFSEGPSIVHPVREGLVFKRIDGKFSFKAISQKYLMAERV